MNRPDVQSILAKAKQGIRVSDLVAAGFTRSQAKDVLARMVANGQLQAHGNTRQRLYLSLCPTFAFPQTAAERRLSVLRLIEQKHLVTKRDVSGHLDCSSRTASYVLEALVRAGEIRPVGAGRNRAYVDANGLAEVASLRAGYERRSAAELRFLRQDVLALCLRETPLGRADVSRRLGVQLDLASRLLRELASQGRLVASGAGPSRRYRRV